MSDYWRFVERVTVRRVGNDFIGEARTHAQFEVGEIQSTPEQALSSAAMKLAKARGWQEQEEDLL